MAKSVDGEHQGSDKDCCNTFQKSIALLCFFAVLFVLLAIGGGGGFKWGPIFPFLASILLRLDSPLADLTGKQSARTVSLFDVSPSAS